MRPFLVAIQFLSRIPIPQRLFQTPITDREISQSLNFYPLVGLLIGLCLLLPYYLLSSLDVDYHISAAILLCCWVFLSGALHLDGLADSADAWIGGLGDKTRTLEIMKDPRCGPAAVVTLVLHLLLKFSLMQYLLAQNEWIWLIIAPLLARTCIPLLFLTTAYVRPGGMGSALSTGPKPPRIISIIVAAAFVVALSPWSGMVAILLATSLFLVLRHIMLKRLDGTTGDTAGALIELVESFVLLGLVCF